MLVKKHLEAENEHNPFELFPKRAVQMLRDMDFKKLNGSRLDFLHPIITELEQWVFNAHFDEWKAIHDALSHDDFNLLNQAYCDWETDLEDDFTGSLNQAQKDTQISEYLLWSRFERLLKKEVGLLQSLTSEKRVLFVGSGPFPVSAIMFKRLTGIGLDCIDCHEGAVDASKDLLNTFEIDDINIIHHSAETFDYSDYDIVIVALLAKPKERILDKISTSGKHSVSVICRTSQGPRSLLYDPTSITNNINRLWDISDFHLAKGKTEDTISSLLLKKTNRG